MSPVHWPKSAGGGFETTNGLPRSATGSPRRRYCPAPTAEFTVFSRSSPVVRFFANAGFREAWRDGKLPGSSCRLFGDHLPLGELQQRAIPQQVRPEPQIAPAR